METENLNGMAGWAVDLMEHLGAFGAGLAIALENLFPPIPSEIVLPLAGFTASRGTFGLVEVLLWTTLGSVTGALALYGLGAGLGRERLRRIVDAMPLLKLEDVDRTEAWFARHGDQAVFFGRMIPLFRSLISIPAGVERMPLLRFTVLTTVGSAIWNTVFVVAGYQLGERWDEVEPYADILQKLVLAALALAVVWFLFQRLSPSARGTMRS
jgi:membrane protein DedA with SNARE-associated domain